MYLSLDNFNKLASEHQVKKNEWQGLMMTNF